MNPSFRRRLRTIVSLILVGLYVAGLVAVVGFSVRAGLILWVISTLGGMGLLYWIRTTEGRGDASANDGDGAAAEGDTPAGEDDRS